MTINPTVFSAFDSAELSGSCDDSSVAERLKWSSYTTYLVNFTTIELEPASVHLFPQKVCEFLMSDPFDYRAVSFLFFDTNEQRWKPLASLGNAPLPTNDIPLFEGTMVIEEEYEYYSFFSILDVAYLIAIAKDETKEAFSRYEYSFHSLFSTLISSFFHMKLLAKDVEEHMVEMSTIRTSAVIFSSLKEGAMTLEQAFLELSASLSFKGMVVALNDEDNSDSDTLNVVIQQGVSGQTWEEILRNIYLSDELFSQDWSLYPLSYNRTVFGAVLFRFSESNPTLAAVQKKVVAYTIPQITTVLTNRKFHMDAMTDALTGIWNRRYIIRALDESLDHVMRNPAKTVSVAMIDIDDFKSVNDQYGHATGDAVLREVARALNDSLRGSDSVGRYGGEEFLVVMHADARAAKVICSRMLNAVRSLAVPIADGGDETVSVTVSIGYSTFVRKRCSTPMCLIAEADKAMYRAKDDGKNRVVQYK